jgi:GNAT superfamily N-acetyltransferase
MDAWDVMNRDCPKFEKRRGGLMEASWCGHPVMFLNMAVTARTPASAREFAAAVEEMKEWAGQRKVPWMLAVCHETMGALMPEAERILGETSFVAMMPLTGMETERLNPPMRPRPEGRWLTESDEGVGGPVLRVNEAGYQMKLAEPGALELEQAGWWGGPERFVSLVEVEGMPASSAAVLNTGGVRYVALVATHPGAQRRGLAEAAMRDVLERSLAAGLSPRTYLHATAPGRPVYARMGYRETANYTLFVLSEHLEAHPDQVEGAGEGTLS